MVSMSSTSSLTYVEQSLPNVTEVLEHDAHFISWT